jgi:hypothetical protein
LRSVGAANQKINPIATAHMRKLISKQILLKLTFEKTPCAILLTIFSVLRALKYYFLGRVRLALRFKVLIGSKMHAE